MVERGDLDNALLVPTLQNPAPASQHTQHIFECVADRAASGMGFAGSCPRSAQASDFEPAPYRAQVRQTCFRFTALTPMAPSVAGTTTWKR